jgi:hypothetical protein
MSDYSPAAHAAYGALAMRLAGVTADEGTGWTSYFRDELAKIGADAGHPLNGEELDPYMLVWWLCRGWQQYAENAAEPGVGAHQLQEWLMSMAVTLEISTLGA